MTCEYDNLEAKAAFSDLIDTIKLVSIEMDYLEDEFVEEPMCTKKHLEIVERLHNLEEIYDRLCDLSEKVNVADNDPVTDDECDDDNCNCHQ